MTDYDLNESFVEYKHKETGKDFKFKFKHNTSKEKNYIKIMIIIEAYKYSIKNSLLINPSTDNQKKRNTNISMMRNRTMLTKRKSVSKVENVKYSKNASFSFETNFDKDIFVVTQMPYEKGWEVKANGKNLEVFSAQGGFVGFVAPKGQVKYTMKFYPANLQLGKYMSAVGAAIFLSTYYGYCFLVKNKELEEQYKNLFKLA